MIHKTHLQQAKSSKKYLLKTLDFQKKSAIINM